MATQEPIRILLVSQSQFWVTSLRTTLAALPQLEIVGVASGGLGASSMAVIERPAIAIIDDSLPLDEIVRLLVLLGTLGERPYCIAVSPTSRQSNSLMAAGADAVVPRSLVSVRIPEVVTAAVSQVRLGQWSMRLPRESDGGLH